MEQTSVRSVKNTSYKISLTKILRAALAELRVHKKLAIITFVLYGVSLLLFMLDGDVRGVHYFSDMLDSTAGKLYPATYSPSGWGVAFMIGGVIVGFFTALNVFRDMGNQQICDVSMALPIKSSERFFSKLAALFLLQPAPLIVSVLGGNGVAVLSASVKWSKVGLSHDTARTVFSIFFAALAASLFIMAVVTLCACCCGTMAESSYFSLITMGIINGLPLAFVWKLIMDCAGYSSSFYEDSIDLGYWGFLFFTRDYEKWIPHCAVGCVISIAVMLLSGLIYVKRDARTVGTPVSSKLFFEIVMTLGCFTIFSLFAMESVAMWGVLIAGVIYVIINVIVSRAKINALSFLKWAGKYFATLAVFTVVLVIAVNTGGFGYINIRPAAKYLEGASFMVYNYDYMMESQNGRDRGARLRTDDLTAEQADKVVDICWKHIAEGRKKLGTFDVIFGRDYKYTATVMVQADSDTVFAKRPYPGGMFRGDSGFDPDKNYIEDGYRLHVYRYINIDHDEAKAMIDALLATGYFINEDDYKGWVYNSSYDDTLDTLDTVDGSVIVDGPTVIS